MQQYYAFVVAVYAATHGPTRESTSIGHSIDFTTEDEAITRSAYITTVTSRTDTTKDNIGKRQQTIVRIAI